MRMVRQPRSQGFSLEGGNEVDGSWQIPVDGSWQIPILFPDEFWQRVKDY